MIPDATLKGKIEALCLEATDKTKFARDWRNRHIAQRVLDLALGTTAKPLPPVEIKQVNDALECFTEMLNGVAGPYLDSETSFKHSVRLHGAIELLYLMDAGHTLQAEHRKRPEAGDYRPELFAAKDLQLRIPASEHSDESISQRTAVIFKADAGQYMIAAENL